MYSTLQESIGKRTHRDEMEMLSRTRCFAAYGVALFHARLREKDEVLGWLEETVSTGLEAQTLNTA